MGDITYGISFPVKVKDSEMITGTDSAWWVDSTSSMQHSSHDGRNPGCLSVAGVELRLQVCVEDADAGREGKGERQHQDGGGHHHPAPTSIGRLRLNLLPSVARLPLLLLGLLIMAVSDELL